MCGGTEKIQIHTISINSTDTQCVHPHIIHGLVYFVDTNIVISVHTISSFNSYTSANNKARVFSTIVKNMNIYKLCVNI